MDMPAFLKIARHLKHLYTEVCSPEQICAPGAGPWAQGAVVSTLHVPHDGWVGFRYDGEAYYGESTRGQMFLIDLNTLSLSEVTPETFRLPPEEGVL